MDSFVRSILDDSESREGSLELAFRPGAHGGVALAGVTRGYQALPPPEGRDATTNLVAASTESQSGRFEVSGGGPVTSPSMNVREGDGAFSPASSSFSSHSLAAGGQTTTWSVGREAAAAPGGSRGELTEKLEGRRISTADFPNSATLRSVVTVEGAQTLSLRDGGGGGGRPLDGRHDSKVRRAGGARREDGYSTNIFEAMFRYALIFINFTFVVASVLLILSGGVVRQNDAVQLCSRCGDVASAAVVFGVLLWLSAIFGFIWIQKRRIVFLLLYVGFLVILFVVLIALVIVGAIFNESAAPTHASEKVLLLAWEKGVNATRGNATSEAICSLQRRFNCSGFYYGCCQPGSCYPVDQEPEWVALVCPTCASPPYPPPAPVVCTSAVYSTMRKNMNSFLVIISFSMLLVVSGIVFAILSRRVQRLTAIFGYQSGGHQVDV